MCLVSVCFKPEACELSASPQGAAQQKGRLNKRYLGLENKVPGSLKPAITPPKVLSVRINSGIEAQKKMFGSPETL